MEILLLLFLKDKMKIIFIQEGTSLLHSYLLVTFVEF